MDKEGRQVSPRPHTQTGDGYKGHVVASTTCGLTLENFELRQPNGKTGTAANFHDQLKRLAGDLLPEGMPRR
ncbi:MAG: hypothetical protein WCC90_10530, partial [Methylocella sp.]